MTASPPDTRSPGQLAYEARAAWRLGTFPNAPQMPAWDDLDFDTWQEEEAGATAVMRWMREQENAHGR